MYQNKLSNLTAFFKFFCYCLFCFEDEPKTGKWWYMAPSEDVVAHGHWLMVVHKTAERR